MISRLFLLTFFSFLFFFSPFFSALLFFYSLLICVDLYQFVFSDLGMYKSFGAPTSGPFGGGGMGVAGESFLGIRSRPRQKRVRTFFPFTLSFSFSFVFFSINHVPYRPAEKSQKKRNRK